MRKWSVKRSGSGWAAIDPECNDGDDGCLWFERWILAVCYATRRATNG